MSSSTRLANSSGLPRRLGKGTSDSVSASHSFSASAFLPAAMRWLMSSLDEHPAGNGDRLIGAADVIAYHSARHGRSNARAIAAGYLRPGQIEEALVYPVTTETTDHPGGYQGAIDEFYTWDQTLSQGLLVDVEHATLGRLSLPGPPLRFFTPGPDGETETTRRDHTAPPTLGADGDAIRAWLSGSAGVGQPDGDDVEDGHAT